ncbi:MAG: hypothetical protein KBG28_06040 [Kofleriaceae bacterium]|nr:hypothetical protein [Kofleriaceae bacterium]MBP9203505.1 hypothetical protein [Kofleriaceae bacterium]
MALALTVHWCSSMKNINTKRSSSLSTTTTTTRAPAVLSGRALAVVTGGGEDRWYWTGSSWAFGDPEVYTGGYGGGNPEGSGVNGNGNNPNNEYVGA